MKFAAAVAFAVSLAPSIALAWDVSVEGPDVFGATKALAATTNGREFLVIQCDSDNELYLALTTPKKEFEEVPTVPATFLIQIDSDAPQKLDASTRAWNNNSMGIVVSDRTPELIRPLTDQNPLAHSLRPIDMMRHGWLSSRRQASQQ